VYEKEKIETLSAKGTLTEDPTEEGRRGKRMDGGFPTEKENQKQHPKT